MSELRDAIDKALPGIVAEHSGHLVTDGVVKVAIMPSAACAIMALIEQSRPSREEFELALQRHVSLEWDFGEGSGSASLEDVQESRREVMRVAGYGEE